MRSASRKLWRPTRHDHEFLEIDVVVGVLAAVEDVHHRHRQDTWRWCRRGSDRAAGRPTCAAAWATASDTPRMALAPSLALFGVPSSSSKVRSIALIERVAADEARARSID